MMVILNRAHLLGGPSIASSADCLILIFGLMHSWEVWENKVP